MTAARKAKKKAKAKPASYPNGSILVETAWLARNLKNPKLRIVDCNVRMTVKPEGGYSIEPGLADWRAAHIPGSQFIDLISELSAPHPTLKFMMPSADHFARVMSMHGVSNKHRVILYSRGPNYWATRLFLMLRAMGHTNVQVLNGGWDKWVLEQRPTATKVKKLAKAVFKPKPQQGQILGKDDVRAALGTSSTCIINALHPDVHAGVKSSYARAGHIPGSVNVFANDLVDPITKAFLPAAQLRKKFAGVGALKAKRVITYCGGGISATTDSFALMLLGHKNVALYDGSMSEWAADASLPLEMGA
jgi:thiosulfate/3-mercaptopyruvate sulfurtransferase